MLHARKHTLPVTIVRICFVSYYSHSLIFFAVCLVNAARPCQRCLKRGVADQCVEGHRKRAKYLLDEEELGLSPFVSGHFSQLTGSGPRAIADQLKRNKSSDGTNSSQTQQAQSQSISQLQPQQQQSLPAQPPPLTITSSGTPPRSMYLPHHSRRATFFQIAADTFSPSDPLFSTPLSFDPAFSFGSEAANLEYSILSAILGKTSPDSQHDSVNSPPNSAPPAADFASTWAPDAFIPSASAGTSGFEASPGALYAGEDFPGSNFLASPALRSAVPPMPQLHPTTLAGALESSQSSQPLHPLAPRWPAPTTNSTYVFGPAAFDRESSLSLSEYGNVGSSRGDEVYAAVTRPYDYTEGYHFLMKILPHRWV